LKDQIKVKTKSFISPTQNLVPDFHTPHRILQSHSKPH